MANTHGFEVVAEIGSAMLQRIVLAAYDSNLIPHSASVAAGTAFGPYLLGNGIGGGGAAVNIDRTGVAVSLGPPDRVVLTVTAHVTASIANPPVPSLAHWVLDPILTVRSPLRTFTTAAGTQNAVGIALGQLVAADVIANLPVDPIPAMSLALVKEFVHTKYTDGTIPAVSTQPVSLAAFTATATLTLYDDDSDPAKRIEVTTPSAGQVKVTIPFLARFTNASAPAQSPFAVNGRIAMVTAVSTGGGTVSANLPAASFTVEGFAPAAGIEGTRYTTNKAGAAAFGIDLDAAVQTQLIARVKAAVVPVSVTVPTQAQLEAFIAEHTRLALVAKGDIVVWSPNSGGNVQLRDVGVRVLPDVIAVAMNSGAGADITALGSFLPTGREFAVAIDGAKVLSEMHAQIRRPKSEGGLGGEPPPSVQLDPVNGKNVTLKRLQIDLRDGSIHTEGDVTVQNAIAGSIDADASFEAEAGLQWIDNSDGSQRLNPITLSTDVDLSGWTWFLSFLIGFLTFAIVGGVIALVVMVIAENVAESVGGAVIKDTVTGQAKGIEAWPQQLEGIGTVDAKFQNPVGIEHDGLVFSG